MNEITTTRNNHLIDPSLTAWGWEIPVYLFLGGMVAGMMLIAGYFLFKGRHKEENCSCYYLPYMSIVLLSIGMGALFLDLEHKLYVWRLYTTFQITSAMSWGSWILSFGLSYSYGKHFTTSAKNVRRKITNNYRMEK